MKNILKSIFVLLTISLMVTSCNDNAFEESSKESSMDKILSDISEISNKENKVVTFNVTLSNGEFIKKNIIVMNYSEFVKGFASGFNSGNEYSNSKVAKVIVTCSDGTETTCAGDDGGCVGSAVKACLDSGECAEVCNARLVYIPKIKS